MRIDTNLGGLAGLQNDATSRTASRMRPTGSAGEHEDFAELSTDGISISELSARVMDAPEVRSDKVHSLRQQIAEGTYQPDAKQIAAAIMDQLLAR